MLEALQAALVARFQDHLVNAHVERGELTLVARA